MSDTVIAPPPASPPKRPVYIRFWWGRRVSPGGLILFVLLALGAFIYGFDNEIGIILGFLAVGVLLVELTHRWRKIRSFLILMAASFFGAVLLAFIHEEVVYPIVGALG